MNAVILAGGAGSRMFPFDKDRQKALLPVGNVPNAVRQFELLRRLGIGPITIVAGCGAQWVRHCFAGYDADICEAQLPGLGAALAAAAGDANETLFLYGDIYLSEPDLAQMLAQPAADCAAAVLVQDETADFEKRDWIGVRCADGRAALFCGHPRPHYVNARSGGVFLLKRELYSCLETAPPVFERVPTGGMPAAGYWIENCLQGALERGAQIETRAARGPLVDIDYVWELMSANILCCEYECAQVTADDFAADARVSASARTGRVRLGTRAVVGDGVVFKGAAIVGDDTVIENGVTVGNNVIIGRGCVIEDRCKLSPGTVVGDRCKIGFTAEVCGVLMDGVAAVHNCELYGVFGRDVDIGAGTSVAFLRFDDGDCAQRESGKRVVHPLAKAAFVGDNSRTGVNCTLLPGARVGGNCCVGPGVVCGGRTEHGTLLLCEQQQLSRKWGPEKYGW